MFGCEFSNVTVKTRTFCGGRRNVAAAAEMCKWGQEVGFTETRRENGWIFAQGTQAITIKEK